MADKRKHPRFRSLNFAAMDGRLYRTIDLSLDGMLLEMGSSPPLGSWMTVSVALGEKVVGVTGEVVRRVDRGRGRTGVGVRFGGLGPQVRWALEEHILERRLHDGG